MSTFLVTNKPSCVANRFLLVHSFVIFNLMKTYMKKLLLIALAITAIFTSHAQSKKTTDTDSVFYSKLKYRLIGPFRGGRSAAVTGSYHNKNTFYFGATGGGVWK